MLEQKHLLGLENYPSKDIKTIIDTAFNFKEVLNRPIKKVPSLQGVTIVNLFFEKWISLFHELLVKNVVLNL